VAAKPHRTFIPAAARAVNDPLTKKTESPLFLNNFDEVSSDFKTNATH
jgi:hypothetical protein